MITRVQTETAQNFSGFFMMPSSENLISSYAKLSPASPANWSWWNKGNKKSRQINGLVNEWYLEDMSENIRSVLTNRRENGFHIGAFALYGYQKDPEQKGHLIVDEEAAAAANFPKHPGAISN